MKVKELALLILLLGVGCGDVPSSNVDSGVNLAVETNDVNAQDPGLEGRNAADPITFSLYNRRYCELLLWDDIEPTFTIYTTLGYSNCPQHRWDAIGAQDVKRATGSRLHIKNGPRYFVVDTTTPPSQLGSDSIFVGGLWMRELVTATIDLSVIFPYTPVAVDRDNPWNFAAGREVYLLHHDAPGAPTETFIMQSYSLSTDPSQTLEDLPGLGDVLDLPSTWSFEVCELQSSYSVQAPEGQPSVVTRDDLNNVYMKVAQPELIPCSESPRIGYEILEIRSRNEIIAWANMTLTQAEFDAIELPRGWFKNQPREIDTDGGSFARSPNASADNEFTDEDHFGYNWRHVATITEANIPLDRQRLLRGNLITKFHEITFNAGRTLSIIVSPDGDSYVRVTRDAGRTNEDPTLPESWQQLEYATPDDLVLQLPNPTLNIRTDNQDSFQGPLPQLDLGL